MVALGRRWRYVVTIVCCGAAVVACEQTSIDGLNVRTEPTTDAAVVASITEVDTPVVIECYTRGAPVHGDPVWYRISSPYEGYVTNYYVSTSGDVLAREDAC